MTETSPVEPKVSAERSEAPRAVMPSQLTQRLVIMVSALALIALAHAHRPTIGESPEARVARRFNAQVSAGEAINVTLESRDGTRKTLADFRGQVVLLNFWASWCPPCLKEMPDLEALSKGMRGRPFSLIALSGDDSWEPVDRVFGGAEVSMKVFRDPNLKDKQHLRWGTEKLPETYVIDKEGRLRLRFINVQPWQDDELVSYLEWLADE